MPRFNNRFIDAETYAFFKKIRMPYNQAHCQTVLFQYMNTSPEAIARSYNLSKEDLVRTVVRRRPGGGLTVNWGNGSFKQFEVGTVMNARIHETNGRPWANSRGTNFWGNFGKSIEKLSEVGESVKPEEVYGPGAVGAKGDSVQLKLPGRKTPVGFKYDQKKNLKGPYSSIEAFISDSLKIEVKHRGDGYRDSVLVWPFVEGPDTLHRITPYGIDLYLRHKDCFYYKGPLLD